MSTQFDSNAGSLQSPSAAPAFPSTWDTVKKILEPLASLKLTVVLFALSIFLVLAGTLAQVDKDIWQVIHEYFRCYFAWVDFQIFFPPSFFPSKPRVPGGIWFPGGWTIGGALAVNLLAAHTVRFTIRARGTQLIWGLASLMAGFLVTFMVIQSGSSDAGVLDNSLVSWNKLWLMLELSLAAAFLGAVYGIFLVGTDKKAERYLLAGVAVTLGSLLGFFLYQGSGWRPDDSGMRILWQLVKGTFAGLVLLFGCWQLFGKRAGIVLLHGGIGLMMFNEIYVGLTNVEAQMQIEEGETVRFVQDIRTLELAVVDRSEKNIDTVTVVPLHFVRESFDSKKPIQNESLPFDIRVDEFLQNSRIVRLPADEKPIATAGQGTVWKAEERRAGSGTDSDSKVDLSAAYVTLLKKGTEEPLGTHLVSIVFSAENQPERVKVGDKEYDVFLRFKRTYKPYSITLKDVRKEDYIGTGTPRDYRSEVRLEDPVRNVDRELPIWMNNPLRFAGETFYQSSYNKYAKTFVNPRTGASEQRLVEATTLAVVSNTGWMIPYVACMIVAVGMLAQFTITLLRFLKRQDASDSLSLQPLVDEQPNAAPKSSSPAIETLKAATARIREKDRREREKSAREQAETLEAQSVGLFAKVFPIALAVIFGLYVISKARVPSPKTGEMDLYAFGQLPLVEQGRIKPFDTLARNSLKIISGRQDYTDANGKKQPAIRWLLDVIADPEAADKHKIFRIENPEIQQLLGLEPRSGYRYALEEFKSKLAEFERQAQRARKVPVQDRDVLQRKLLEMELRTQTYAMLDAAFAQPNLPPIPTQEEFNRDRAASKEKLEALQSVVLNISRELKEKHAPLAVSTRIGSSSDVEGEEGKIEDWVPYTVAWMHGKISMEMLDKRPMAGTTALNRIFIYYAKGEVERFNTEVKDYAKLLQGASIPNLNLSRVRFEAFFNHFEPFYYAAVINVIAFILAALAWLGWRGPLNSASFWLIAVSLVVHTFGLWARMKISGRPPVTNLYSSAVFIGWGAVVLGMILERIYKLGVGNVIASVAGFSTLLIAHMLSGEGDTFTVLQAVLDTQFWLATHVTCITFGYATTYVSGLLGLVYVVLGAFTPALTKEVGRSLARMMYGTLCFAIFFSFVGTVLGGLWADDSWGRFWGWDPKENGALIIVLWNALVLHARWGHMIKDRGLAALAIGGNIVTSWSWFGVNELGVGLHSYGFTEGVLFALGIFVLSQLLFMGGCALPKGVWRSDRNKEREWVG